MERPGPAAPVTYDVELAFKVQDPEPAEGDAAIARGHLLLPYRGNPNPGKSGPGWYTAVWNNEGGKFLLPEEDLNILWKHVLDV